MTESIIAGPPVDHDPRFAAMLARADLVPPAPYVHSVIFRCVMCRQRVWIGPTQRVYLATHPAAPVMCLVCAVIVGSSSGGTTARALNDHDGPRMARGTY